MYVIKLILINYVFIIISYWNKGMITSNPFLQGGYSSSLNISERPNERYYFPYTKKNIMKPGFLVSTGN